MTDGSNGSLQSGAQQMLILGYVAVALGELFKKGNVSQLCHVISRRS